MNSKLVEVSSAEFEISQRNGRDHGSESWGLTRFVQHASKRLATRKANMLADQETERLWFWRLVKLEVERTRRRDHAFSVLCVRNLDASVLAELAHRLRPQLRDTDAVLAERDRLLILLSDTSGADAKSAMRRLADQSDLLPHEADWTEVQFPRDALTLGALIECLLRPDMGERLLLAG
jgi:hypothetical protein